MFLLGIFTNPILPVSALGISSTVITTSKTSSGFNSTNYNSTKSILPIFENPLTVTHNFGNDLGTIQSEFNPNGTFSMLNIYNQNLTLGRLQINGVKQNSTHVFYNSTTEIFNFGNVQEYFNKYQSAKGVGFSVSIKGVSSLPENISIPFFGVTQSNLVTGFVNATNHTIVTRDTHQLHFGYELYDYSDSLAYSPTFNNHTNILTWQIPSGSFNIDPLAIDGSAICGTQSSNSFGCALTTSASPDVIMVIVNVFTNTVTSVSDGTDSYTQRFSGSSTSAGVTDHYYEYYDVWTSPHTRTITVATSGTTFISVLVFGVSGANTASPFDPNGALPASSTGSTAVSITTSNPNDMLIVSAGDVNGGNPTPPTSGSWTIVKDMNNVNFLDLATEYQVVSSTQSGLSVSFNTGGAVNAQMTFADAIQQAPNTVTIHVQTTTNNHSPFATITLSGCVSTTYTADGSLHTISGVTASGTCTETVPSDLTHTRYRFPNGTLASRTWQFTSCPSGICGNWLNTITWQIGLAFFAWPVTVTLSNSKMEGQLFDLFDASYNITVTTGYVGNTNTSCIIAPTLFSTDVPCNNTATLRWWTDANTTSTYQINPVIGVTPQTQWMCEFQCSYLDNNASNIFSNANYYNPPIVGSSGKIVDEGSILAIGLLSGFTFMAIFRRRKHSQ